MSLRQKGVRPHFKKGVRNLFYRAAALLALISAPRAYATALQTPEGREQISYHYINSRWDLPWDVVIVGLGAILAAIAAVSLYRWWQNRNDDPTPLVLFSAIARKAGLSWGERLLLWRIARRQKLDSPIALLLARGTLRHHANLFAQHLSPRGRDRLTYRIEKLSERLFGPTPQR